MNATVNISIELFGTARMACGRRRIDAQVPADACIGDVVSALAKICPELVGVALRQDLSGLLASYTLNLNATAFIMDDDLSLQEGDALLLFSSQAGG